MLMYSVCIVYYSLSMGSSNQLPMQIMPYIATSLSNVKHAPRTSTYVHIQPTVYRLFTASDYLHGMVFLGWLCYRSRPLCPDSFRRLNFSRSNSIRGMHLGLTPEGSTLVYTFQGRTFATQKRICIHS